MTTCILCLRNDGGGKDREHVLQSFLGARWLLPPGVVCDRCNSTTSALDGDLKRFVTTTVMRDEQKSVLGRGKAVVRIRGRWWVTQVRDPGFERYLPPQLVLPRDEQQPALLWAGSAAEAAAVRRELRSGFQGDMIAPEGLEEILGDQRILVRSRPGKYDLWCEPDCIAEAKRLGAPPRLSYAEIQEVEGLKSDFAEQGGQVVGVMQTNVSHVHRALAKVAMNFVAHFLGPEIARSPLFSATRRFVLNGENHRNALLSMDALRTIAGEGTTDGLAIARELFEKTGGEATSLANDVVQEGRHVVLLGSNSRGVFLYAALYGEPLAFVPLISAIPGAELRGILGGAVVDLKSARNDELGRLPEHQRSELAKLIAPWEGPIASTLLPPPSPVFVASPALPFRFEFTYNRHPDLPPIVPPPKEE